MGFPDVEHPSKFNCECGVILGKTWKPLLTSLKNYTKDQVFLDASHTEVLASTLTHNKYIKHGDILNRLWSYAA